MQAARLAQPIQAVLLAAAVGCGAQQPPPSAPVAASPTTTDLKNEVKELRADVVKLTERVEKLEKAPAPTWSCAAQCLLGYSCKSNGESTVDWKSKTATGTTAANAFAQLSKLCDDILYVEGKCTGGAFVRTQATVLNACVKN